MNYLLSYPDKFWVVSDIVGHNFLTNKNKLNCILQTIKIKK